MPSDETKPRIDQQKKTEPCLPPRLLSQVNDLVVTLVVIHRLGLVVVDGGLVVVDGLGLVVVVRVAVGLGNILVLGGGGGVVVAVDVGGGSGGGGGGDATFSKVMREGSSSFR